MAGIGPFPKKTEWDTEVDLSHLQVIVAAVVVMLQP